MNRIWDFGAFEGKAALIDDTGVTVSYDDLQTLQNQLSGMEGAGELTMMLCENSIGALSGYAALLNSGHPMLMLSAGLPEDMRRPIMNTYRPGLVFAPSQLAGDYPYMREILKIDSYVLLKTNYAEPWPVNPALALMLTTSGSTGSMKFVRQSWDNIRFNNRIHRDSLQFSERDRTITGLPMNYTYGLSIINANLMMGATMIVTRHNVMDEEFWDLFENEHVTAFHGVSGTYDMLHRLEIFSEDFPDLRIMTQGGTKLDRELHRDIARYAEEHGKLFFAMYGQCEATAGISFLPAERALDKAGSVGNAFPGGEIELVDTEGKPVTGAHAPGELVYRGGNVALGYAVRGEDLSRGDDWNGVLHTGDIAERDEEGFLYITGRLRRFIKVSGHRISLDEIDERIMNDTNIRCVSTGVDDHLVFFVLSEENGTAVREYIRRKISVVRSSFTVVTIAAFPVNEAGKILYGDLLAMAELHEGKSTFDRQEKHLHPDRPD